MRTLLAALGAGVLGAGLTACGGAGDGAGSSARSSSSSTAAQTEVTSTVPTYAPPAPVKAKADADRDNDGNGPAGDEQSNSRRIDEIGPAASASDTRAIATVVKRYYAAAVAEDGAKACSLLYSPVAESVPEDYGTSPPGQPYLRGATCPAVMTLLFKHYHPQLALEYPKLEVASAHLRGRRGVAVLRFGNLPERELPVGREGNRWKVLALLDDELH